MMEKRWEIEPRGHVVIPKLAKRSPISCRLVLPDNSPPIASCLNNSGRSDFAFFALDFYSS